MPIVHRTEAGEALSLRAELRDVAAHANLLGQLIRRDLTIRYKRSVLGLLWTMLHPLLLMLIFTIVFSAVFRRQTPHYETFFLSAYVAWNFFAQTTTYSMASAAWNGSLIKRVRIPKSIFPLASTISGLINAALALAVLVIIMIIVRAPLHPSIIVVPFSLFIVAVLTLGICLALTSVSIFFADVREMYQAGLPALLYLSPVIYPAEIVPERYRWIVQSNPLTFMIEIVRDPIYRGHVPSLRTYGIAGGTAFVCLAIGWMVFRRLAPRFESRF